LNFVSHLKEINIPDYYLRFNKALALIAVTKDHVTELRAAGWLSNLRRCWRRDG